MGIFNSVVDFGKTISGYNAAKGMLNQTGILGNPNQGVAGALKEQQPKINTTLDQYQQEQLGTGPRDVRQDRNRTASLSGMPAGELYGRASMKPYGAVSRNGLVGSVSQAFVPSSMSSTDQSPLSPEEQAQQEIYNQQWKTGKGDNSIAGRYRQNTTDVSATGQEAMSGLGAGGMAEQGLDSLKGYNPNFTAAGLTNAVGKLNAYASSVNPSQQAWNAYQQKPNVASDIASGTTAGEDYYAKLQAGLDPFAYQQKRGIADLINAQMASGMSNSGAGIRGMNDLQAQMSDKRNQAMQGAASLAQSGQLGRGALFNQTEQTAADIAAKATTAQQAANELMLNGENDLADKVLNDDKLNLDWRKSLQVASLDIATTRSQQSLGREALKSQNTLAGLSFETGVKKDVLEGRLKALGLDVAYEKALAAGDQQAINNILSIAGLATKAA